MRFSNSSIILWFRFIWISDSFYASGPLIIAFFLSFKLPLRGWTRLRKELTELFSSAPSSLRSMKTLNFFVLVVSLIRKEFEKNSRINSRFASLCSLMKLESWTPFSRASSQILWVFLFLKFFEPSVVSLIRTYELMPLFFNLIFTLYELRCTPLKDKSLFFLEGFDPLLPNLSRVIS